MLTLEPNSDPVKLASRPRWKVVPHHHHPLFPSRSDAICVPACWPCFSFCFCEIGFCCIAQADLVLMVILLPQPPTYWVCRHDISIYPVLSGAGVCSGGTPQGADARVMFWFAFLPSRRTEHGCGCMSSPPEEDAGASP